MQNRMHNIQVARQSLYEIDIPFPCVVVLGNETAGLSASVKKRCDARVHIPGMDAVQSLNVSVAAGVVLGELFRLSQKSPRVRKSKS